MSNAEINWLQQHQTDSAPSKMMHQCCGALSPAANFHQHKQLTVAWVAVPMWEGGLQPRLNRGPPRAKKRIYPQLNLKKIFLYWTARQWLPMGTTWSPSMLHILSPLKPRGLGGRMKAPRQQLHCLREISSRARSRAINRTGFQERN